MELNFKGYHLNYKNVTQEFDKFIGNFEELLSTIKILFKIEKNNSISISYVDCDGHFDIINQNKYNEVLSYHMNKNDEFINIAIKDLIRNRSEFTYLDHSQNYSLMNENKEIYSNNENYEMKKFIKNNNKDLIGLIDKTIKEYIMPLENIMKKLNLSNKKYKNLMINQENFSFIKNIKDPDNDINSYMNNVNEFKSNHICKVCNSWDMKPKFNCTICHNFYLCTFCEKEHSNHPLITICDDDVFNKDKILLNYLNNHNSISFNKQLFLHKDRLNFHINVMNNITEMIPNEKYSLDIQIINLSNFLVKPKELILTGFNNCFFKIENKIVDKLISNKQGNVVESIQIISPNREGQYYFEIGLIHSYAIINFNSVKININVFQNNYISYNYVSLDNFFLSFPNIITKLSFDHKLQIINIMKEKLTNLDLSDIDRILECNNYEFDKSLNQILNIN